MKFEGVNDNDQVINNFLVNGCGWWGGSQCMYGREWRMTSWFPLKILTNKLFFEWKVEGGSSLYFNPPSSLK